MRYLIEFYILLIIVDSLLSYAPEFRQQSWAKKIKQAADLSLRPIRKALPQDLPFDFSPLIVIMALNLLMLIF
jgi:YggT family protein